MGVMRRFIWVALALAIVISLAAAYGAYLLADYSWNQVVSYRSPFADEERPWAGQPAGERGAESPATPRVVLIIVDGMQLRASREMGALNTLRGYGADMVAIAPQPSLSYPTWTNILSGAPQQVSGVTTNWFDTAVPVETLFDVAHAAGAAVVVSAPDDFETLYLQDRDEIVGRSYFKPWTEGEYMSAGYVDEAIALIEREHPQLIVVHLPDADDTAHEFGADSEEYRAVLARIDGDLAHLVAAVQDDRTTFVICADHGHVPSGGHGGWEADAIETPAVFLGRGVQLGSGSMDQSDIAPTVAALMGWDIPRHAAGRVRGEVLIDPIDAVASGETQARTFASRYLQVVEGSDERLGEAGSYDELGAVLQAASDERMATERSERVPVAAGLAAAALIVLLAIVLMSWRALVAVLAGTSAYYALYNALYFIVHGHRWSLSAFNTESYLETFFNIRMAEAAASGLAAALVAGFVYAALRKEPHGPREKGYLAGWLTLGPATVLAVQATLALQVAWFLWAWGASVTWSLPDFLWGFKYDLDLIQATALGAATLVAPVVTYLVGRYHPKMRRS
jgi:hypothetical protein